MPFKLCGRALLELTPQASSFGLESEGREHPAVSGTIHPSDRGRASETSNHRLPAPKEATFVARRIEKRKFGSNEQQLPPSFEELA